MVRRAFLALVLLGTVTSASGKVSHVGKVEMVRMAECIAIVNVTEIQEVRQRGPLWIYQQKALGTIEQCLKGGVAGRINVYGMEAIVCAPARCEKGRFLLFLQKDGDLWHSVNWQLGIRPIKEGKVQWFGSGESQLGMTEVPLTEVLSEIAGIREEKEKRPPRKSM